MTACDLHRRVRYEVRLMLLTLCGLTSQKTHRGGLGLGGSVHEEAHPCFPYFVQPSFKGIDADVRDGCFSSGGKCLAEATVRGGYAYIRRRQCSRQRDGAVEFSAILRGGSMNNSTRQRVPPPTRSNGICDLSSCWSAGYHADRGTVLSKVVFLCGPTGGGSF